MLGVEGGLQIVVSTNALSLVFYINDYPSSSGNDCSTCDFPGPFRSLGETGLSSCNATHVSCFHFGNQHSKGER